MRGACRRCCANSEAGVLHRDALTVNGKTIGKNVTEAPCWNREVIHAFADPFKANAGITVLHGNLAPDGAVIKSSAASPQLLQHRGRAVVFETLKNITPRSMRDLDIDENCMMVLKNCGPRGYPGMAEVGNMAPAAKASAERRHRHGPHF